MNKLTRHHVIASQKGGTWHHDNIVLLPRDSHDAVHHLFDNDVPFQIIRGILNRYKHAMSPDAYREMDRVLQRVEHTLDAYNPKCFDPDILKHYVK